MRPGKVVGLGWAWCRDPLHLAPVPQFRAQAAVAVAGLAVVAIVLALTGPHLIHLCDTTVATCKAHGNCPAATSAFLRNDRYLQEGLAQLLLVVPALTGIFWGAPLVARELETGTFRLGWTQGVTRTRWLAAKLAIIGLASMAAGGLASLMATWWSSPIDRVNTIPFTVFPERDIVPLGYAAFAFTLGVSAGLLIRRTLPAMAVTLVAYIAARAAVTELRPHFQPPVTARQKLPGNVDPGTLWPRHRHPAAPRRLGALQQHPHSDRAALQPRKTQVPGVGPARAEPQRDGCPSRRKDLQHPCPGIRGPAPGSHHLPARRPLLALPGLRDGDLPRPRGHPGRSLLLVDPPPPHLTPTPANSFAAVLSRPDRAATSSRRPGQLRRRWQRRYGHHDQAASGARQHLGDS